MRSFDSIIIGSGAGGLAAALSLARAGQKVAVVEQHYVPGGWCHSFYINGHRFSPGVHYIGSLDKGASTSSLYEGLGIANDLVFFRMNPEGYERCWIGDERIKLPADKQKLYESLSERFTEDRKGLKKYLSLVKLVSNEIQLISKMKGFWDNISIPFRTKHLGKYGLFSLKRVVRWHIKNPLLQKVISIQCGDHGLSPSKASFPLHCALMDHYLQGGFYPMGGGAAIVKAMTKAIKKYQGEIYTGMAVKSIITEKFQKGYRATGVELQNGEKLMATNIISNTDPGATFKLIGLDKLSNKLQGRLSKTKYSVTSLMFFISVEMDLRAAGMDSGNIWVMPNHDMDDLEENLSVGSDAQTDTFSSMFISSSSLKDPTAYNGKQHTLEVVTFINYDLFNAEIGSAGKDSDAYRELKDRLCNKLLNSLEKLFPGIRQHIDMIELGTPLTNEYFINSTRGNVYGTEKGFFQTGPFSFTSITEIKNLYMCGASILSHGVAGAAYSGVKTAAVILNCTEADLLKADSTQEVRIYEADDSSCWPGWLHKKIADKKKHFKVNRAMKPA